MNPLRRYTTPTSWPHFRLADGSDAQTPYDIRQLAILQLARSHLSKDEAENWATQGSLVRIEEAIAADAVLVAVCDHQVVGWLHLAANLIKGLYVLLMPHTMDLARP